MLKTRRISDYELVLPRQGNMVVDASIFASERINLEKSAVEQLAAGASIPSAQRVLATPDIHQGYGVPIGSVLGMGDVVVPAAVGFDINCGMRVLTTNLNARDVDTGRLAKNTRSDIPLGEGKSNVSVSQGDLETILEAGVTGLFDIKHKGHQVWDHWDDAVERPDLHRIEDSGSMAGDPGAVNPVAKNRGRDQLASLGGGNHFIEYQVVEEIFDGGIAQRFGLFSGQLLAMIHSGSRGLGHQVGGDYMKLAAKKTGGAKQVEYLSIADRDGRNYIGAMNAAANFAFVNRHLMSILIRKNILQLYPNARINLLYDVPHNIAKFEAYGGQNLLVHRKGATRAFGPRKMNRTSFADTGQPVLIPGTMGTASYILSGLDNTDRNLSSVNHGAGRVMSRTQARGKWVKNKMVRPPAISDFEFKQAMEGVMLISADPRSVREEAPQAYKDIDLVMDTVLGAGLANAVARLRPLAVLKG